MPVSHSLSKASARPCAADVARPRTRPALPSDDAGRACFLYRAALTEHQLANAVRLVMLEYAHGRITLTDAEYEDLAALAQDRFRAFAGEDSPSFGLQPLRERMMEGVVEAGRTVARSLDKAYLRARRALATCNLVVPFLARLVSEAHRAVLTVVALVVKQKGMCDASIAEIARRASVSRRTVQSALRGAEALGVLTIEERRVTRDRSLTNVIRIASPRWRAHIAKDGSHRRHRDGRDRQDRPDTNPWTPEPATAALAGRAAARSDRRRELYTPSTAPALLSGGGGCKRLHPKSRTMI